MLDKPETPKKSAYWDYDQLATPVSASPEEDELQQGGMAAQQPQQGGHVGAWQTPALASRSAAAPVPSSPPPSPPQRGFRPSLLQIVVGLIVVVLLGVGGSVSGYQFNGLINHRGQASAPPTATAGHLPTTTPGTTATVSPRVTATATPTVRVTTPTPQSTPPPQAAVLAQDNFQRPNQTFWGMASDGSTWGGDANNAPAFSIVAGRGVVTGGQGYFNAVLGPRQASEEVVYSGAISHFNNGYDNLGAVLRWTGNNDYYKAYLDGSSLILIKRVAGVATRLGAVPFTAQGGVSYTLRFRAVGAQLFVRSWQTGTAEPGNWTVSATDSSLQSGFGGLRVLLQNGISVTITAFRERSIA